MDVIPGLENITGYKGFDKSLNPCCDGCDSGTAATNTGEQSAATVLILVVMDVIPGQQMDYLTPELFRSLNPCCDGCDSGTTY